MPEIKPASALSDRPCPFITFYSFKGGVGRSMAAINVAGIIASRGFRVLVVDMDLEAPGLSFLANQAPSDGEARRLQPGFVDFLLDAVEQGGDGDLFQLSAAEAVSRYCAPYELPEGFRRTPGGTLQIMPAGQLDEDYPGRLDRLNLPLLYSEGTGLALIKAFKQAVQEAELFDYVLIDSRTGFSDESGICTRDLADYLMVVSGLNKQNVEGTTSFLAALRRATDERKPLEVILSPIPNGEDALVDEREAQAREAFHKAWGAPVPTDLQIPYHPQLALTEEPHIFRRRRGYLFEAYNKIERRLMSLLGETWDVALTSANHALGSKDYVAAEAHFRRASKLADTQEWADRAALLLKPALIADVGVEAVFRFIIAQANSSAREVLGYRLGDEAERRAAKEPDVAEVLYERALEADPQNDKSLGSYANFLCNERKEIDAAEGMYKRALEADPNNEIHLGNYAVLLWRDRKDSTAAEVMFERTLESAPNDVNGLGNYGWFRITSGRVVEGMELVDRALKTRVDVSSPEAIDAECWMYVYCCGEPDRHLEALQQLRALVEIHAVNTEDWDFAGVIQQAAVMDHGEHTWLPALAEVVAGRQPPTTLDEWPAWRAAAPD